MFHGAGKTLEMAYIAADVLKLGYA